MQKVEELEVVPRCPICKHEDREGIEMVGILSASSWRIAARRINNTFGTNFTAAAVEKHMLNHRLHKTAVEAGEILDSAIDPERPVITTTNILRTLMIQGMLDVARGTIRCKSVNEIIQVMNAYENVKRNERMQMMMEEGDAAGFYAAMAAYGEAIKDTVSPEQLGAIVMKANALGARFNIGNVVEAHPIGEEEQVQAALMQAVVDGRNKRTRDELVDAGVIQVEGVVLPD